MTNDLTKRDSGSFRDPSGAVFSYEGKIYRSVNEVYKDKYEALMQSGLYEDLVSSDMLIRHEEQNDISFCGVRSYKIICPEIIPFISYPYEWSFGELKDAAVLTLKICLKALEKGMVLKDASAYNVQFLNGSPVFIDTLSFDFYKEGSPWVAYGQFCRHFLAPLLLMAYTDINLNKLLITYIDGIPIPLADTLLHNKGGMFAKQHISWQAKAIEKHDSDASTVKAIKQPKISLFQFKAMLESMIRGIEALKQSENITEWGDYYKRTNYNETSEARKEELVAEYLKTVAPKTVWDIGANDGRYSLKAVAAGASVVAFDIDQTATERNYMRVKKDKLPMLPLLYDFTNPSPSIGFANKERKTIEQRQKPDLIMLLAVIHHMRISNNLPFDMIAQWLSEATENIIIEFVPKEDSQVQILLATRDDIFDDYNAETFEKEFSLYFDIIEKKDIEASKRTLYLMRSKAVSDEKE